MIVYLLLFAMLASPAARQVTRTPVETAHPAEAQPTLLDITLERKVDGKAETVASTHVFHTGDTIRLRLKSHYNGYLYVMNQGTSGSFATVFPASDTGSDNRLVADHEYLVPAIDEGWFEVQGPPGFDTLYFLLSPAQLARPAASAFTMPGPASSLRPRCNDKVFRARGECMDANAGPAALPQGKALPAPLAPIAGSASRDIVFQKKSDGTVAVTGETSAPVIYTFRLAHQ